MRVDFLQLGSYLVGSILLGIVGCTLAPRQAVHFDQAFPASEIELLTIVSPIDGRPDRNATASLDKVIEHRLEILLPFHGYRSELVGDGGDPSALGTEDLKTADPDLIRGLGPDDRRWVFLVVLDGVSTEVGLGSGGFLFGSTGNAEVSAFLFDTQAGTLLWHDKGAGRFDQGGLIGLVAEESAGRGAVISAIEDAIQSLPDGPFPTPKKPGPHNRASR